MDGPGLIGEGDLGSEVADGRQAHGSERSRRLHDEQQAAPHGDRGVGRRADIREAAGRPGHERLVDERVGQAACRDALDPGAQRQQRDEVAGPPGSGRSTGPPSGPGARRARSANARRGSSPGGRPARASPAGRCWRARGRSEAAQGADDDQPGPRRGAAPRGRELGVRFVLVGRDRSSGTPAASSAASASSPIESPSPTHRSMVTPSRRRDARRRRRRRRARPPRPSRARPCRARRGSARRRRRG